MSIDKKEILEKADIAVVIGKRVKLKKEGNNYVGLCPFHNEKSGSFTVSPKKQIYKCFGCGRSGDVLAFIEQFEHLDFQDAIEQLARECNIIDGAEQKKEYDLPEPRTGALSDELRNYLTIERKISLSTINKLGITGSVEYVVKAKAKLPVICFNFYRAGKLINIKLRPSTKQMQLMGGCELLPYNCDSIYKQYEACITEGEIDCASLIESGIFNVVSAPNGATSNSNTQWTGHYFDKKSKIILFTDDDEVGRSLREKLCKRLGYHRCYWVTYPEGCKDVNDVLVKHGPDQVKEVYRTAYLAPLPTPAVADTTQLSMMIQDPDESMTFQSVTSTGRISYKVNLPGVLKWARDIGYCWIRYAANEDSPVMLVRHSENIIYPVTEQDVLAEYQREVDLNYSNDNAERIILYNFAKAFMQQLPLLPYFTNQILSDQRDCAYLCFLNGVLKVQAETAALIEYRSIEHSVWSRYIIPHDYHPAESGGNFNDFIQAISIDADHYISILSHLGYLLHSYKLRTTAKAVIIVEDVEDESEARGRSGKGLMAQFVELFKNTVQQDGRNYKTDDKFKLQRVDLSTQVFYINDPAPGLLMNQFYNMITDDFLVEAKGLKSYTIPFKRSPKMLVTTNHLPALTSDSDRDRFAIITIKKTFGATEQISTRFPGVLFFDKEHWPKNQFLAGFQLAVEAIQIWLGNGLIRFSTPEMEANASKRLIGATIPDYVTEVMEQVLGIAEHNKGQILFKEALRECDLSPYKDMLDRSFGWNEGDIDINMTFYYRYAINAYKAKISQTWFGRKVRFYLENAGLKFEEKKSSNNFRVITIVLSGHSNDQKILL